jgi:TonB-dependent receptor
MSRYQVLARLTGCLALALAGVLAFATGAHAQQQPEGTIRGSVSDTARAPLVAVVVRLAGTRLGALTDKTGAFVVEHVPPGSYTVMVRTPGYAPVSFAAAVDSGAVCSRTVTLHRSMESLGEVVVRASPRLNETKEQALFKQRQADNIVTVLSGDEIRALPNANAAEAVARIPGITTERDEGEGKFVQVRGTEPRLSNVTINGAHVPGTETGSRVAKLDDVPTDILGAIEVSKTLTADMDADAIGGSVNLVTKTPEGAPRGYVAGQFGQASLLERTQGQGSLMWGGRFGSDQRLGFLLGGTYDANNRAINDLELGWNADDAGRVTPVEWDQRDYVYNRTRYGAGGDLDYRFADGSIAYLKGMWSTFNNFGTRYRTDVALGDDSAQAASGAKGIGTGAQFVRESSNRTPSEQMFGFTGGGTKLFGLTELKFATNYAGTRQSVHDYRTSDFEYDGPGGDGLALRYDGSNRKYPSYRFLSAADATLASAPANFGMTKYSRTDGLTTGHDLGGGVDVTRRYSTGDRASSLQFGVKYRDEQKEYVNHNSAYAPTSSFLLSQVLGGFSDPDFYHSLAGGYVMGPQPDNDAARAIENANAASFKNTSSAVKNALASYSGGEKIAAGYVMNTANLGALRVNLGLRVENTAVNFLGNVATTPGDSTGKAIGPAAVRAVPGTKHYTDLFPSLQLRLAANDQTNIRLAFTRGIARANYSDIAPHLSGEVCPSCRLKFSNLSAGNPDLKPQHAWNVDLLAERYINRTGVLSGGVFFKRIDDFIYKRQFVYTGPATEFVGYLGTQPQNGGSGHVLGSEFDYTQRLDFLRGFWSGFGFDVNWTHIDSRAQLLADTAKSAATLGSPLVRHAPLARQPKHIANAAVTYDARYVSARAAWQYQGESIYSYGDGSATPSGDNWLFPHSQIDASVTVNMTRDVSLQIQGLNLNNAVFGFYNGIPGASFSNQREYYGRSVIMGIKYGFGAVPGTR